MVFSRRSTVLVCVAGMALGFWPGCQTTAKISISRPQVFSRERLVEARWREYEWLRKELGKDVEPSFQGLRDRRVLESLVARVSAAYAPGTEAAPAAAEKPPAGGQASAADVKALSARLDELQKTLATMEGAGLKLPEPKPVRSEAELTSIEQFNDRLAYRNAVGAAMREAQLDDAHDLLGRTLYTLKFDIIVTPGSNSQRYALAELRLKEPEFTESDWELLYKKWFRSLQREVVEEAIRLQRRDFRETLPELTSETVLILAKMDDERTKIKSMAAELKAEAAAIRQGRRGLESLSDTGRPWAGVKLSRALELEFAARLARRPGFADALPDKRPEVVFKMAGEMAKVAEELAKVADEMAETRSELRERLSASLTKMQQTAQAASEDPGASDKAQEAYAQYVPVYLLSEYALGLGELVKRGTHEDDLGLMPEVQAVDLHDRTYYVPRFLPVKGGGQLLNDRIDAILPEGRRKPYALSVEPKEYAQNISDVAARQDVLNLTALLSATLPEGAAIEGAVDYLRKSSTLLQGIVRQPLLIGFGEGRDRMGWLIGPKFMIEDDLQAAFRHVAVRHAVNASVVVPAWWPTLTVQPRYYWIDREGRRRKVTAGLRALLSAFSLGSAPSDAELTESNDIVIDLPGDVSALTAALMSDHRSARPRPRIDPFVDENGKLRRSVLTAKDKGAVLVRGRGLWRNPSVFIGSQRADGVDILPDMGGLLATFNPVAMPAHTGEEPPPMDLTVVTSFGADVVPGAVVVLPAKPAAHLKPFAQIEDPFYTAAGPMRIGSGDTKYPRALHSLRVRLRPARSSEDWTTLTAKPVWESDTLVKFDIRAAEGTKLPTGEYEVDLQLRLSERDDPVSILVGKRQDIVYFATENESRLELLHPGSGGIAFTKDDGEWHPGNVRLSVGIPDPPGVKLFHKAHPWLDADKAPETAYEIRLQAKDGTADTFGATATKRGAWVVDKQARLATWLRDGGEKDYDLELVYRVGGKERNALRTKTPLKVAVRPAS